MAGSPGPCRQALQTFALVMAALLPSSCLGRGVPRAEMDAVAHGADPTGREDCTELLTALHATGKPIYSPNGIYRFNGGT